MADVQAAVALAVGDAGGQTERLAWERVSLNHRDTLSTHGIGSVARFAGAHRAAREGAAREEHHGSDPIIQEKYAPAPSGSS